MTHQVQENKKLAFVLKGGFIENKEGRKRSPEESVPGILHSTKLAFYKDVPRQTDGQTERSSTRQRL